MVIITERMQVALPQYRPSTVQHSSNTVSCTSSMIHEAALLDRLASDWNALGRCSNALWHQQTLCKCTVITTLTIDVH